MALSQYHRAYLFQNDREPGEPESDAAITYNQAYFK